jgi:DNA-binding GntR family transcriptional regulator
VSAIILDRNRRTQSLAHIVTEQIRDMIITDKLSLGDQLSEGDLAIRLGVSRTPVREAFQRLEMERLVEIQPQRGTYVFQFDITELREICELREVLEVGALRMAVTRDAEGLKEVVGARFAEAQAALAEGPAGFQVYDSRFHEALVRASENRELVDAYARVSGRVRAIRFRLTHTEERIVSAQADHGVIAQLILDGRFVEAERRLGLHVHNGYRVFLATVTERGAGTA